MKKTFFVPANSNVTVEIPDPYINETIVPVVVPPDTTNKPPVANAGTDKTIILPVNSVVLDASGSTDPENKIKSYGWRKVVGPPCIIKNPSLAITEVTDMTEGSYVFELRVTDDKNAFSADRINVTVKKDIVIPPTNTPPIAKAGNDQTVLLPLNRLNLDGSLSIDPDGQIKSYAWTKTSGPSVTMLGANTGVLSLENLQAGTYVFRLTITDNNDATNSDEVTVTVKPEIIVEPPTAGTYTLNLTQNKTLTKLRHFAGFENWNGQNYASFTGGWADYYFRFCITDIEKGENGTIDWTRYDNEVKKAINQRAGFALGFMVVCDSDTFLARETWDNATSRFPKKWWDQMQAESVKPFVRSGMHIPNWNSNSFLSNLEAFVKRVQLHNETTSHNGVFFKDIINYVDIRVYASWGEWHNGGIFGNVSEFPAGTRPSVATYKRIIDMHCDAFTNYPCVVLFAGYDANRLGHTMTPPEITHYLLTKRNNWGLIGWRRDQWGNGRNTGDTYVHDYLEDNFRSFSDSGPFNQVIMERWKYAPIVGEPYGPGADLSDLKRQVEFYHTCSVGNGNYPNTAAAQALFKAAAEAAGAKLSLNKGVAKVSTEFDFDITITAENFGNCPVYNDRLNLVYELRNSAGSVVWTSNSTWKPVLKIPGTYPISDHYKITTVPAGTYSLVGVIKDNYRALPLYNDRQNADGTIVLATGIKF